MAGPGCCIDVMHVVIVFEFYNLAFVAFGSFFWWCRVKELNCDFSCMDVYFGETCCWALECIRSGRFSAKPPNPSHISRDYIIKLCACFMLLGQSRDSKLKLIWILYKEALRCQFLQHYYSKSSREFFEGEARMKYRLDLDWSQAVGRAGQSSHFSSQLRCEWEAGRERQLCCLLDKRVFFCRFSEPSCVIQIIIQHCKAVREHLNIVVWGFFVYLFSYVPFLICLSSRQWSWFTKCGKSVLKNVCQNANLTLNIFLYLIFRNVNLWYFEKRWQILFHQGLGILKK